MSSGNHRLQAIEIELDRIVQQAIEEKPIPARDWLSIIETTIYYAIDAGMIPEVIKAAVDAQALMVAAQSDQ